MCDFCPDLKNTESAVVLGQVFFFVFRFSSYAIAYLHFGTKRTESQLHFHLILIYSWSIIPFEFVLLIYLNFHYFFIEMLL
jgi:hypothetical protein